VLSIPIGAPDPEGALRNFLADPSSCDMPRSGWIRTSDATLMSGDAEVEVGTHPKVNGWFVTGPGWCGTGSRAQVHDGVAVSPPQRRVGRTSRTMLRAEGVNAADVLLRSVGVVLRLGVRAHRSDLGGVVRRRVGRGGHPAGAVEASDGCSPEQAREEAVTAALTCVRARGGGELRFGRRHDWHLLTWTGHRPSVCHPG